jgi:hypothetical protein
MLIVVNTVPLNIMECLVELGYRVVVGFHRRTLIK